MPPPEPLVTLYLIGFRQRGKLLFGIYVIGVSVWVVLLCQLKQNTEGHLFLLSTVPVEAV